MNRDDKGHFAPNKQPPVWAGKKCVDCNRYGTSFCEKWNDIPGATIACSMFAIEVAK